MGLQKISIFYNPEIKEEVIDSISEIMESGIYVGGPHTRQFEKEFAQYCGTKYAITFANGTVALYAVFMSLTKNNDQILASDYRNVIVPSHTFIATVNALHFSNYSPYFCDISEKTYLVNCEDVEKIIKSSKKDKKMAGIVGVHLYGLPTEADTLSNLAHENELFFVEDAAQAHGATFKGRKVGNLYSDAACFSFYPTKNLNVLGEGGMVVTNNKDLYEKLLLIRNHGEERRYVSKRPGLNLRLSEIHAAIGRIQLRYIDKWNERRQALASLYDSELNDSILNDHLKTPAVPEDREHVYHQYVIRVKRSVREKLREYLKGHGISTGVHYPIPVHKQQAYKSYNNLSLPVTERICKEIISLPIHPALKESDIIYVTEKIKHFFKECNF